MTLSKQEIQNCADPERLLRWAKAKPEHIRRLVAGNRHTPPEALALLAETCDGKSLLAVAKNPNTPPESLARIVDRFEDKSRTWSPLDLPTITAVTENPSAPLKVLESLAAHPDSEWRLQATRAVRQRQGMPDPEALLGERCWFRFFCDESTAYLNTNWTDGLWLLLPEGVCAHLAGNVAVPAEYLERLSRGESAIVRAMVAGNVATPPDILARLAGDDKDTVRHCLARNPSCPADILAVLVEDLCEQVRTAALERLRERQKA